MKSVKTHRYTSEDGVVLYDAMNGIEVCRLEKGSWLGVLAVHGDWLQVITAQQNGWVRTSETILAKPYSLTAKIGNAVSGIVQNYILL